MKSISLFATLAAVVTGSAVVGCMMSAHETQQSPEQLRPVKSENETLDNFEKIVDNVNPTMVDVFGNEPGFGRSRLDAALGKHVIGAADTKHEFLIIGAAGASVWVAGTKTSPPDAKNVELRGLPLPFSITKRNGVYKQPAPSNVEAFRDFVRKHFGARAKGEVDGNYVVLRPIKAPAEACASCHAGIEKGDVIGSLVYFVPKESLTPHPSE